MGLIRLFSLITLILPCTAAQAQFEFKTLRFDEDYSSLKIDSSIGWYKKMKRIPLAQNKGYLSFGGEVRYQYYTIKSEAWGEATPANDRYNLSRFLLHADVHASPHFRTFVQLQSSEAVNRNFVTPIDENALDLHQAFIDYADTGKTGLKFILRAGRQELTYGSQRLVSVRERPNNRQSFDGLKAMLRKDSSSLDLFYSNVVVPKAGPWDDASNDSLSLWGAYATVSGLPFFGKADVYYLGYKNGFHTLANAAGKEVRHSAGARLFGGKSGWQYDFESLYQFGRIAGQRIAAWTASVNAGYQWQRAFLKPAVGLRTEIISGDGDSTDRKIQTFNPLYPRGSYFGLASLIGPSNLVDIHPSFSITYKILSFIFDVDVFWRRRLNDGLYATSVEVLYRPSSSAARYVGNQITGELDYKVSDFLLLQAEYTYFFAGRFLKDAGTGKNIQFGGITLQFKF